MRKIFLLFILIPLLSFNTSLADKQLIGKWEGKDEKNKVGTIIFDNEGYATIQIDGQAFGGKEFDVNGNKASMTYSINREVKPVEIDFIITSLETHIEMRMLMIAEFDGDNTMTIASDFNNTRPTEFNSGNSIKLYRIQ
ncbi:hypothetical protein [Psychroserpens mesophilus]|uniref:hypothetical protein n=1 Tax=Psychroserpens mesophilus TaxID=325473 RepID=UPI003F4985FC